MGRNPKWSVSVRELSEFVWKNGDIGSHKSASRGPTLQQGSAGHRLVQQSRMENYQSEVFLQETVNNGALELEVSGRADGIFHKAQPVIIEEIKTTNQPLIFVRGEENSLHWAQAKLYGAIYLKDHPDDGVDIQLTYFHVSSREVRSFKKTFSRLDLRSFFKETVDCYCAWLARITAWHAIRDDTLAALVFPYPAYRRGQQELVERVDQALTTNTALFVEAPTGSGKTMAILYGSLLSFGRGDLRQIVYLTAKTVGRLSVEQAVADLSPQGIQIKCLSLVSRENICPYPQAVCRGGECPVAEGHYDRLPAARIALFERSSLERHIVQEVAAQCRVCPHSLQMEMVRWVDIVVGDYNYFFDPKSRLHTLVSGSVSKCRGLLLDEAHNLVERAREMHSVSVQTEQISAFLRKLDPTGSPTYKSLQNLARDIEMALKAIWKQKLSTDKNVRILHKLPQNLLRLFEDFNFHIEGLLDSLARPELLTDAWSLSGDLSALLQIESKSIPSDILYLAKNRRHFVLKSFCVDPSKHLSETIRKSRVKPIFFSGTLSPFGYFSRILSGSDQQWSFRLPSPFPSQNCQPLFIRGISTRYARRSATLQPLVDVIRTVALAHRGNYMAFFPSYDYLNLVAPLLAKTNPDLELLAQHPRMTEVEKDNYLEQFRQKRETSLVGLAVLGGLFSEGIDLVGEHLEGAILVSPGLPKLCLERELIRQYFQQEEQRGFEFAYLYPGMNKVLQAAGRVIRSENDRGILLFVGDRFHTPLYRRLIPDHWRGGSTISSLSGLQQQLQSFWTNSG